MHFSIAELCSVEDCALLLCLVEDCALLLRFICCCALLLCLVEDCALLLRRSCFEPLFGRAVGCIAVRVEAAAVGGCVHNV